MSQFKDLFSGHAADYARYRPTYPPELFAYLAACAPARALACDIGTGNGQAARALAAHFEAVVAIDPSARQIAEASPHPKVRFQVGSAEATGLPSHAFDLVTVAQALHWFRHEPFFAEVRRIARPGGVLAVWTYSLARISPAVDAVVEHLYRERLRDDWEPERRWVDEGYRNFAIPFEHELSPPSFTMTAEWTLEQWRGYLGTWSAVRTHRERTGNDPLAAIEADLAAAWGGGVRTVRWPLALRLGTLRA